MKFFRKVRQFNHRPSKKTLILFISIFTAIMALVIYSIATTPRDLGPKLHYVGRETSGCLPPPLFGCFSPIITTFYYATDLSEEELKDYLKNANYVEQSSDGHGELPPTYYNMIFKSKITDNYFSVLYYIDTESIIKEAKLKKTKYRYIIEVSDTEYKTIQEVL